VNEKREKTETVIELRAAISRVGAPVKFNYEPELRRVSSHSRLESEKVFPISPREKKTFFCCKSTKRVPLDLRISYPEGGLSRLDGWLAVCVNQLMSSIYAEPRGERFIIRLSQNQRVGTSQSSLRKTKIFARFIFLWVEEAKRRDNANRASEVKLREKRNKLSRPTGRLGEGELCMCGVSCDRHEELFFG
jgi:hypothetical protein